MKRTIKQAIKAAGLKTENFKITSDGQFESTLDNVRKANAESGKVVKELRKAGHRVNGFKTGYGLWIYDVNMSAGDLYRRELAFSNID